MLKGGYQIIRMNPNIDLTETPKHVEFAYYDATHTWKKRTILSSLNFEGRVWDDFEVVFDRTDKDDIKAVIHADLNNGLVVFTKIHINKLSQVWITKEAMSIPEAFVYREFESETSDFTTGTNILWKGKIKIKTLYNAKTNEAILMDADISDISYIGGSYRGTDDINYNYSFDFIALNNMSFTASLTVYKKGNTSLYMRDFIYNADYIISVSNDVKLNAIGIRAINSVSNTNAVFNTYSSTDNSVFYTKNIEPLNDIFNQSPSTNNQISELPVYITLMGRNGRTIAIDSIINTVSVSTIYLTARTMKAGQKFTQTNNYKLTAGVSSVLLPNISRPINGFKKTLKYYVIVDNVKINGVLTISLSGSNIVYTNVLTPESDITVKAGRYNIKWL